MTRSVEFADVVVVGCGSAAFAAAIASRQLGAERVLMLEKAPEPEFGGNPRWSHSGFRWVQSGPAEVREFVPDVADDEFALMDIKTYEPDDFRRDLNSATRGQMDQELLNALVDDSNAAMHWLKDVGLRWQLDVKLKIEGRYYFEPGYSIHPQGGGLGQLLRLREIALGLGIEIRYDAPVTGLIGNVRQVDGVAVAGPEGAYAVQAPAVFLCSGGFQANPELRARYLPPNADVMKVRGSPYNTGEVLQMALALGAGAAGQWSNGHASIVAADAPQYSLIGKRYSRYSYPYGISVNRLGFRYCDEGEDLRMRTYAKMGWKALGESEGMAWQIFDRKANDFNGETLLRSGYRAGGTSYEAESIVGLAEQIGINPEVLAATIAAYNEAVDDGTPFDPSRLDGRRTVGLLPPKSNWATRIDEPPFVAYPVSAGITFTFGGLRINPDGQVLDTVGRPIRGLYASGDIVGLFYHGYVGSTGQTRNVVFSRRAARHAIAVMTGDPGTPGADRASGSSIAVDPRDGAYESAAPIPASLPMTDPATRPDPAG